jgi:hypothetical protein
MAIPVFHDDQHGTAIISAAAFLNALELVGKKPENVRVVFSGAGAAGIGCANLYMAMGVKPEHLLLCDSQGVLYEGRENGLNEWKLPFVRKTKARTLEDALVGADVFVGVSVAGAVTPAMLKGMAKPIIFAIAGRPGNPYPDARRRADAIVATGRSDFRTRSTTCSGSRSSRRARRAPRRSQRNKDRAVWALPRARACADEAQPPASSRSLRPRVHHPEAVRRALLWSRPRSRAAIFMRCAPQIDPRPIATERLLGLEPVLRRSSHSREPGQAHRSSQARTRRSCACQIVVEADRPPGPARRPGARAAQDGGPGRQADVESSAERLGTGWLLIACSRARSEGRRRVEATTLATRHVRPPMVDAGAAGSRRHQPLSRTLRPR